MAAFFSPFFQIGVSFCMILLLRSIQIIELAVVVSKEARYALQAKILCLSTGPVGSIQGQCRISISLQREEQKSL